MVEVCVYADISVTGTTFERPEFDRMIQDIRAGKINTVITRDLSRLGRNYVEAGNYIERVFPFLDVRYIAITDDFDTARPGTDLSVPLKNIVNEYYSKDLSKKVETGKHSIWAQGGFSEGTPPYGYYRSTDGSRKLLKLCKAKESFRHRNTDFTKPEKLSLPKKQGNGTIRT